MKKGFSATVLITILILTYTGLYSDQFYQNHLDKPSELTCPAGYELMCIKVSQGGGGGIGGGSGGGSGSGTLETTDPLFLSLLLQHVSPESRDVLANELELSELDLAQLAEIHNTYQSTFANINWVNNGSMASATDIDQQIINNEMQLVIDHASTMNIDSRRLTRTLDRLQTLTTTELDR